MSGDQRHDDDASHAMTDDLVDNVTSLAGRIALDVAPERDPDGASPYRISFLAPDTAILTSAGWIQAGQLSVGDPVLTWDIDNSVLVERGIVAQSREARRLMTFTFEETRDAVSVTELHALRLPEGRRLAALATPGLVIQTVEITGEKTTRTIRSATLSDTEVDAVRLTVEGRAPAIASGVLTCATRPTRWRPVALMLEIMEAERRAGAARQAGDAHQADAEHPAPRRDRSAA